MRADHHRMDQLRVRYLVGLLRDARAPYLRAQGNRALMRIRAAAEVYRLQLISDISEAAIPSDQRDQAAERSDRCAAIVDQITGILAQRPI